MKKIGREAILGTSSLRLSGGSLVLEDRVRRCRGRHMTVQLPTLAKPETSSDLLAPSVRAPAPSDDDGGQRLRARLPFEASSRHRPTGPSPPIRLGSTSALCSRKSMPALDVLVEVPAPGVRVSLAVALAPAVVEQHAVPVFQRACAPACAFRCDRGRRLPRRGSCDGTYQPSSSSPSLVSELHALVGGAQVGLRARRPASHAIRRTRCDTGRAKSATRTRTASRLEEPARHSAAPEPSSKRRERPERP